MQVLVCTCDMSCIQRELTRIKYCSRLRVCRYPLSHAKGRRKCSFSWHALHCILHLHLKLVSVQVGTFGHVSRCVPLSLSREVCKRKHKFRRAAKACSNASVGATPSATARHTTNSFRTQFGSCDCVQLTTYVPALPICHSLPYKAPEIQS